MQDTTKPPLTRARLGPEGSLISQLDGEPIPTVIRTIADLRADPERLVDAADIARCGLAGSYSAIRRWVTSGGLKPPFKLSGQRLGWRAGDILDAIEPPQDKPETVTSPPDAKLEPYALTINSAAKFASLSRATIYEMLGRGEIKGVRVGRRTLVVTDSLRTNLANRPPYASTVGPGAADEPRRQRGEAAS